VRELYHSAVTGSCEFLGFRSGVFEVPAVLSSKFEISKANNLLRRFGRRRGQFRQLRGNTSQKYGDVTESCHYLQAADVNAGY
jgi:hypothetical protein